MDGRIYLDYAATAPLHPVAASTTEGYIGQDSEAFALNANANSLHTEGRKAFSALEDARAKLAQVFGVRPFELVFTSGATESNNTALFGLSQGSKIAQSRVPHIVTTSIEHDASFRAAQSLESLGLVTFTYVQPETSGHINPETIAAALAPETVLVSVIAVHNETGAINDIQAIGEVVHEHGALFHIDAVQALGKLPLSLSELPVDAASFSAHKIGGPKGVGLLYLKSQTPFKPFLVGGGQESGIRSGTQNVLGANAFAELAMQLCGSSEQVLTESARLRAMRDKLYSELCSIEGVEASVPCSAGSENYAPHIVNVCVDGMESETLILQFDLAGIAVSGGSACSSHSLEPSRSLLELGIPRDKALGSLRLSLGWNTTEEDINTCITTCKNIVNNFSA